MFRFIIFFAVMSFIQVTSAVVVGTISIGNDLPLSATIQIAQGIEKGWKVMGSPTMHLGDVQSNSVCKVSGLGEISCELIYNPQYIDGRIDSTSTYSFLYKVTARLSYLDDIAGESIHEFKLESVPLVK